ncbi:hypothetical protein WA026_010539 [Henosepilachna vigintioctopunctata]|uniref:Cubilin n=1 Tax=Henosepilachna vigintioctopunctata TaxID=420089 RepID=A0AAW1V5X1_9CUCU
MIVNDFCLKILFLVLLSTYNSASDPMIISSDGNIIMKTSIHKNITFETNEQCAVFIDGEDVIEGFSMMNKLERTMKQYEYILGTSSSKINRYWLLMIQRNGIGQRLRRMENVTRTFSNSSFRNIDLLRSEITSIENSVHFLQTLATNNECRSSPCKNGGTCHDLFNGTYCKCATGWEGITCEKDVDECARFNSTDLGCQNGGICINKPGTYECMCLKNWYGLHCTRRSNGCDSGSAEEICGHGICISQNTNVGFKCVCDQGWKKSVEGYACTQDVDECKEENPRCSKDPPVSCENTMGSFRCGPCPEGYTGNGFYCSDVNECEQSNGGCSMNPMVQCVNVPGSRKCGDCPPGYIGNGVKCTYQGICNINNGNCHPLAKCREYPNIGMTYAECTCPDGYTGNGIGPMGCIHSASPCETNPCHNGRCHPDRYALEGYTCKCRGLYYGKHCELTDGACGSNPCQNGATCVAHNTTSYRCLCPPEYTGSNCAIVLQECGGNLGLMEEGSVTFPLGSPTPRSGNLDCSWQIRTEVEKIFNLTFESFNVGDGDVCDRAWVQIIERKMNDKVSNKFCGNKLPNGSVLTLTNDIVINLKKDSRPASFQLKWTSLDTRCHEKFNLSEKSYGILKSPGAPGNYPNNKDCFWYLQGPITDELITHSHSIHSILAMILTALGIIWRFSHHSLKVKISSPRYVADQFQQS